MSACTLFSYWFSASAYFALAYACYRFFFAGRQPFQRGRMILLGLLGWSLLLPLIPAMQAGVLPQYSLPAIDFQEWMAPAPGPAAWSWSALYVAGIFIALVWSILQLLLLAGVIRGALPLGAGAYLLRKSFRGGGFTFMQRIYLSPDIDAGLQSVILRHEEVHRRQWHCLDLILLRAVLLFGWFNPFFYLALRDLKRLHEYQADALSARQYPHEYAGALIACAFRVPLASILHTFSSPNLQKRLAMLHQTQNAPRQYLRVLALLPFMLMTLFVQVGCSQTPEETAVEPASMPEFPGGQAALSQFMQTQLRYPEDARKDKIEGMVVTHFVIDEDGRVLDAAVVKKVHPQLDAEALRAVGAMPKWKPGSKDGKNVRAEFTLPIKFAL